MARIERDINTLILWIIVSPVSKKVASFVYMASVEYKLCWIDSIIWYSTIDNIQCNVVSPPMHDLAPPSPLPRNNTIFQTWLGLTGVNSKGAQTFSCDSCITVKSPNLWQLISGGQNISKLFKSPTGWFLPPGSAGHIWLIFSPFYRSCSSDKYLWQLIRGGQNISRLFKSPTGCPPAWCWTHLTDIPYLLQVFVTSICYKYLWQLISGGQNISRIFKSPTGCPPASWSCSWTHLTDIPSLLPILFKSRGSAEIDRTQEFVGQVWSKIITT